MDDYPKTPRHTTVKDNLIAEALMAMYVAVDCLDQGDGAEGQGARGGGRLPARVLNLHVKRGAER